MKLPIATEFIEEKIEETLTFYSYPDNHWVRIRTNNALERIMCERVGDITSPRGAHAKALMYSLVDSTEACGLRIPSLFASAARAIPSREHGAAAPRAATDYY